MKIHFILLFFGLLISPCFSKPKITVTPAIVKNSGDTITITWSNIDLPSNLDWVGLYSPPNSPHDHFIGYKFLSSSPNWQSGSGSISLPITNLRSNYTFRIFRWTESEINPKLHDHDHNPLPGTAHLLAESEEVGFVSGGDRPEQIHLTYTDIEDEMRVMYVAGDKEERAVKWGEADGEWSHVSVARVVRYEREDMCDAPANGSIGWRDPGWIHDAVMNKLKKGFRYYYQVGSDSRGWSLTRSFVSRNGDTDEAVAFLFGDMGTATPFSTFIRTQDESIATMKWILRDLEAIGDKPSFVSHIGDISYARGYSWIWDQFFTQIEPVASRVPYHVCIGNHEYDWPLQPWKPDWATYGTDGGGECGVPYSLKFNMPGNSSEPTGSRAPATRNLYYSFDMGAVHFVYISTETNFLVGSSQHNFLKQDLELVNRSKTPFVVVQGHRPMYTTSHETRDTALRNKMLEHLEPLLVKYNVTLALWGHVHRYERFCPVNNLKCGSTWKGFPVHVVIGMAGQDWQPIWQPRVDHPDDPIFPQPERSIYRGGEFGYTRLVATKDKLTFSYVGNHDGEVHDMVEMFASGEVYSGNGGGSGSNEVLGAKLEMVADSTFSTFVKGASVLVLGAFIGYILGFISHARKQSGERGNWSPVKSDEVEAV
ncbi:probable inactive purple acid phosphatase 2 [Mercurialis annua]|uniref:probable inactive purple acid phosphatase 2 n=1 Tax=Mercurialis annua TaxID=3986 RepID=UPI00215F761D|nr:probable inactive purple acid phosphatase 2 [Mercurialis annua]